jgi:hypothetical protein
LRNRHANQSDTLPRIATADLRVIGTPKPLDHGAGFDLVVSILAQHNVTVA